MKSKQLFVIFTLLITFSARAQYVTIPDPSFANFLSTNYPGCMSGNMLDTTCAGVVNETYLDISNNYTDITGMQYFDNLDCLIVMNTNITALPPIPPGVQYMKCNYNSNLSALNQLPSSLTQLWCGDNDLTSLPPLPSSLQYLACSWNSITALPSLPSGLVNLQCELNNITSLPILPPTLTYLTCDSNSISALPSLPASLQLLSCGSNPLGTLPALPAALASLSCSGSQLTTLPALPSSLIYLYCNNNNLQQLPSLPGSLISLQAGNNQISSLPTLPPGLENLGVENNLLTTLPSLPQSLRYLYCSYNNISTLPSLPGILYDLSCNNNALTSLPSLPGSLSHINCNYNQITTLPPLPGSLYDLRCSHNLLTSFPLVPSPSQITDMDVSYNQIVNVTALPSVIINLDISHNQISSLPPVLYVYFLDCRYNQITSIASLNDIYSLEIDYNPISCLPILPASLGSLYCDSTNITCLPNLPSQSFTSNPILPLCNPSNNSCDYGYISGKVYLDINANGIQDAGEPPMPNYIVQAQAGNRYGTTNSAGNYTIAADTGNYTITVSNPGYYIPDTTHTASFTSPNQSDSLNDFGLLLPVPAVHDLAVSSYFTTNIRPGFPSTQVITYTNHGTDTIASGFVQLVHDSNLVYQSSSPVAGSINNDTLTWNYTNLFPGASSTIYVSYTLPASVPIGTPIVEYLSIRPDSGDAAPNDNDLVMNEIVTGAYDPNSKEVYPSGDITPWEASIATPLTYIINFQNMGTDTAFNIVVEDTLSSNLYIPSFELIGSSHPVTWEISGQGLLKFTFANILLPDTFVNEPASHGSVAYRIRPLTTLWVGDQIENTAYIYFDFNTAIVTNTTVTTVDTITGIAAAHTIANGLAIFPNPADDAINISYENAGECEYAISLIDMAGRVLHADQVNASNGLNHSIGLSGLAQGMYCVQVSGCDTVITRRVIKK